MAIDPKTAKICLTSLKDALVLDTKLDRRYLEAIDFALDTVELRGSRNSALVYFPDRSLMPYSHIRTVTELTSEISTKRLKEDAEKSKGHPIAKPMSITLTGEHLEAVSMALMIYKNILINVNKEEIREQNRKMLDELEGKKEAKADGKAGCTARQVNVS